MITLQTIETDVAKLFKGTASDVEKFASAFDKLFHKAPSALQTIESFTTEVAPIITAAVAIADPVAEPEVAGALALAETSLAALQAAATNAVSGQSLLQNLENFSTSVPNILGALEIKNPALKASVSRIVTLVVGEAKVLIPAVQTWVTQLKAAAPATA
ncbi:hypothetical protein DYQ86_16080 [Acidobacteria bacterium AB60]|nr:hypothetical protein DYQ86_16080 [Acidobacteria bacterium AB60]